MVKDSFGADSYPLSSHGWPPPNKVNEWLDAATIVLTTDDSLLVRSVGSHIAALAMSNSDSVVDADGVSRVTWRRHSSSDIHHWLEASALLLTTPELSLARPIYFHVGVLTTQYGNTGAGGQPSLSVRTASVADEVLDYLEAVAILLAIDKSTVGGSHSAGPEPFVVSEISARTSGMLPVPLVSSGAHAGCSRTAR